jgi:serine/threonine protein kinase
VNSRDTNEGVAMTDTQSPDTPPRGMDLTDPVVKREKVSSTPSPAREPIRAARGSLADMLVGTVLNERYRLLRKLGEGAMGWVFLAEHVEIGKQVAVKVLRPSLCKLPEAVRRFRREARTASQIGSGHIVDITDFGTTPNGAVFYVMEYLADGEDLSRTLKREGKLPWPRVVEMLRQLCDALQAAHDADIIHRDCKPANFYRTHHQGNPDFIKVLDFGIARLATPKDSIVTATGVIMGTPDFMAPEQAQGKHVDHRADIYSLGGSVYALLTGRPPFIGANEYDVIYKQLNENPRPPSEVVPGIPHWLDAAVLRAMAKDPAQRFQSMREFAAAVDPATMSAASIEAIPPASSTRHVAPRPGAMPISPIVLIVALVGLIAVGALGTYLLFLT